MKKLQFLPLYLVALLFNKLSTQGCAAFNQTEQQYIRNVVNLTNTAELEEFFDAQTSIFVDNVYDAYQRFFYRLLGDLPRGQRYTDLKQLIIILDGVLEENSVHVKLKRFDNFEAQYSKLFDNIFEYDSKEVLLNAKEFYALFEENGIEELLIFVNHLQTNAYVKYTGNGIRYFLLYHRPRLDKTKVILFKAIVDEFLDSTSLQEKRKSLLSFLRISDELLFMNTKHK